MRNFVQVSSGCVYTELWHPEVHLLEGKGMWSDGVGRGQMRPTQCKAEHTWPSQLVSEGADLVKAKAFHEEEKKIETEH